MRPTDPNDPYDYERPLPPVRPRPPTEQPAPVFQTPQARSIGVYVVAAIGIVFAVAIIVAAFGG